MAEVRAIEWAGDRLRLLDQTRLPQERQVLELTEWRQVVRCIREMRVRGAPALGITAAYALALAARQAEGQGRAAVLASLQAAADGLVASRPTAVNIGWAVERMLRRAHAVGKGASLAEELVQEAQRIQREDEEANRRMGRYGAELFPEGSGVLTHCNTGALATGAYGTAQGLIRAAWERGRRFRVYVTETRPVLQGARLTTWELAQLGIPVTLVVDSAAGLLMQRGQVSTVVVGADRIAANGDVANKIGTYSLAVLASEHHIPFYVAAPTSTVDLKVPSGDRIVIEERPAEEVTHIAGVTIAPEGLQVRNPAFDITPHAYISAIITEKGIIEEPYTEGLQRVCGV